MKRGIFSTLLVSLISVLMPGMVVKADTIGGQLSDNDMLIDYMHDNMSFFLDYDTELRDGTVISVVNEKGDAVPDGKGPSSSANPLVKEIENPLSMAKRGFKATYTFADDAFTISPLTSDYYTFLGWDYDYSSVDGSIGNAVVDASALEKSITVEKGSQGSRHYTAYWRQNLLTVLYNAGEDVNGVHAVNKGASSYKVGDNGLIGKNDDYRITSAGSEGKVSVFKINDLTSINLVLPDYHIVSGKEWVDDEGTVVPAGKEYLTTDISPAIKDGDVTRTLTANWVPNEYVVTYDFGKVDSTLDDKSIYQPVFSDSKNSDGYEASAVTGSYNKWTGNQKFTYETVGVLPKPTMQDYNFDGWYTSSGSRIETWDDLKDATKQDNRNVTLTAKWTEATFTLTYDLDRNDLPEKLAVDTGVVKPSMDGYEIKGGHNSYTASEECSVSKNGKLPVPEREFYTFNGWFYGDKKITTFKEYLELTGRADRNATIEADWSPVKYQITYDYDAENLPSELVVDTGRVAPKMSDPLNGKEYTVNGTHNTYSTVLSYTVQNTGELPAPGRSYYSFDGWTLSGEKVATYPEIFNGLDSHNGTVEGHWTPVTYKITYVTDTREAAPSVCKESISLPADVITEYTVETPRQKLVAPTMTAYAFKTWHSSTNDKDVSTLTALEPLGDATLTAVWEPVDYTITWDNKGNRTGMVNTVTNENVTTFNAETYTDASKNVFKDASCDGYEFKAWYLEDGTKVEKAEELPFANTKVKADWDILDYTITYVSSDIGDTRWSYTNTDKDALEASMASANKVTYNAETPSFTLVNPSMRHESFTGWSGSGVGNSITVQKGSFGDKEYIANWSQNHSFGSYITDKSATCEGYGSKHRTCSICSHREDATISKLGHNYSSKVTKEATCTATGNRHYECSRCSSSYDSSIAKKAHSYEWKTTKEATCTAAGSKQYECKACGDVSSTSTISALGHDSGTYQYTHYCLGNTITLSRQKYCNRCAKTGRATVVESLQRRTTTFGGHKAGCTSSDISGGCNASYTNSATFYCHGCGGSASYSY